VRGWATPAGVEPAACSSESAFQNSTPDDSCYHIDMIKVMALNGLRPMLTPNMRRSSAGVKFNLDADWVAKSDAELHTRNINDVMQRAIKLMFTCDWPLE
jgi:hypothetical protein